LSGVIMNRCLSSQIQPSKLKNMATEFMAARRERQSLAIKKYSRGMMAIDALKNLPLWSLSELGAVAEPLENEIVELFLGGLHDR
jgi:hypothetical protein